MQGSDLLDVQTSGAFIAGLVIGALEESEEYTETASLALQSVRPLKRGVLVDNLPPEVASKLIRRGMDIRCEGGLSHVTMNLEFAAKARSAGKKAKSKSADVKKRLTADEKRVAEIKSGAIKNLVTPQAASLVKKIWTQFIESGEDYTLYPSFFKDLDRLITEYRVHAGVDEVPATEIDGNTEDETDDYDPSAIVGSASPDQLSLLDTLLQAGFPMPRRLMEAAVGRRLSQEVASIEAKEEVAA